jgi:hypothetical protein
MVSGCTSQGEIMEDSGFALEDSGAPYIAEDLVVYPVWRGTPEGVVAFRVKAGGHDVGVYSDTNGWGMPVNWACLNIKEGAEANVEVEPDFEFETYKILPEGLGIQGVRDGGKIGLPAKAGQNITLVFDDNYTGAVIHIFVSPIDPDQPEKSTVSLTYFGPGYHDLYKSHGGQLLITRSNSTVYIAPGAVVNGTIKFQDVRNCRITGGGILMMSELPPENMIPLVFIRTTACSIGNIIVNSRAVPVDGPNKPRRGTWSTALNTCSDMVVDGYRVVSPTYASTDSLNLQIANSPMKNVTVKNCFLRACDDTISLKGHGNYNSNTNWQTMENIQVFDTILWSDANNAMVVGEESAAKYKNISFRNIDVIFSYPDAMNLFHEERSVMSIVSLHGTYFSDITWDNIRVNDCQRLICLTFLDDFWYGSFKGNQRLEGGISNITFSNITSTAPDDASDIANEVRINGYDAAKIPANPKKYIENITFDNVVINGEKLTESYGRLVITNEYVRNLIFK